MYDYGFPKAMIGERILSGIWMEHLEPTQIVEIYGDDLAWIHDQGAAETWLILLDGRLWRITEDRDDGYRSHCRDIREITNMMPVNWWQVSEKVDVYHVSHWPGSYHWKETSVGWWLPDWEPQTKDERIERCELLAFISHATNKPVCIFGTDNTDDYYPIFVAKFMPQNMGVNERMIDMTGRTQQ